MIENIKANLFTIHGAITSLLHVFLVVGLLSSWMYLTVAWYGEDFTIPSYEAVRTSKK